jgi:hypothetical protein
MNDFNVNSTARLATLAQLRVILKNILDPVPSIESLRDTFDKAGIPRYKSNPTAKRGGGIVYYSVPHVEKFFRSRMVPA